MRKKILRISLVVGIVLFCLVIYKVGPGQILNYIKRLSWKSFLVLFGLRIIYWILRTFNWKTVARFFDLRQSYFLLFEARIVANAISYLTPSAMLGGEPIRALMGQERRVHGEPVAFYRLNESNPAAIKFVDGFAADLGHDIYADPDRVDLPLDFRNFIVPGHFQRY